MLRRIFAILAGVSLLLPSVTSAKEKGPSWGVDLQFGSYKPRIDSQFARDAGDVKPPFEEAFGDGTELMFSVGSERLIPTLVGTFAVGASIGYWNVEGTAVQADASAGNEASDTTELSIFPMNLQMSYRFDLLDRYIPFVPVARGGFDYYMWRVLDGSGDLASFSNGNEAQGATMGYHYAFGVHLLLDVLDQEMASDFERDAGVYNSYITLEYRYAQVDDFGSSKSFRLGDETFFVGLALDL